MLAWLEGQLARQGYQAREVEQLAVSDLSCILHIQTNRGELYLKCCDPAFPHEPPLAQALSQFWPGSVPGVLAITLPQNWMLMEDAGQVLDERHPEKARDLACWQEIISAYVGMQIEAISQRDYLLSQGCPDRRLKLLPGLFEAALADKEMWCIGREGGLTHEELTRLRGLMSRLEGMCEELANYGIPERCTTMTSTQEILWSEKSALCSLIGQSVSLLTPSICWPLSGAMRASLPVSSLDAIALHNVTDFCVSFMVAHIPC